jgi:hypothetical protein
MSDFVDGLNHPLLFVFFMLLALWGMAAIVTYVFKTLGWSGPAAWIQHP